MIQFFRRIRKSLLAENRLRKYFLYALGEIILVVVGILIALQINNWNTSQQETATLNGYLNNISKNIQSDLQDLESMRAFRDSSIMGSRYFLELLDESNATTPSYKRYFSDYFKFNPWLDESFQSNQSGFEALKNSGYLSKIQGISLESELYKYYSLVEKIKSEEQSLNNFMEEMEYDMYKNDVVQDTKRLIKKLFSNSETRSDVSELNRVLHYPAFAGSHSRNAGTGYMLTLYDELAGIGIELESNIRSMTTH